MTVIGQKDVSQAVFDNANKLSLIAGPCQIEGKEHALRHALNIAQMCEKLNIDFVYKSSFDKGNRSRGDTPRGVGIEEGLRILEDVRDRVGCPVTTDMHTTHQAPEVAQVVDLIQIPALLSRQTDILVAAGLTGLPINIKKGQFSAPWDMRNAVEKIGRVGVMLTERGTTFGYNNLVVDMRSLSIMRDHTGCDIIFDGTHSVQLPGGTGQASGGQREYVASLTRAAVAVGVAGVFLEVHEDPDKAPSDGPCMVALEFLPHLLRQLKQIDDIVKNGELR